MLSFVAPAQNEDSLMLKFNELNNKLYSRPVNYIKGNQLLYEYKDYFVHTSLESFFHQASATFYAASGNQFKAKKHYWLSKGKKMDSLKVVFGSLENYRNIFRYTENKKVVMINENHAFPEHRVFTTSLLDSLFKQGFRYLALEDLLSAKIINQRSTPYLSDGLYINEVMYSEMVRKALDIGFTMVAYDNNDAWDIRERDSLATQELKKVFEKDLNAKMIIHCGFGHIDESKKVLASFIKSKLGIDPLTISQTSLQPVIVEKFIEEPKLILGTLNPKLFETKSDFQVIHPNYDYAIRPEYLFVNERQKVQLELNFDVSEELILEVYQNKQSDGAVPYDRIIIEPKTKSIDISAPRGLLKILFKNQNDEIVKRMKISN
ncbi:hypothetical protein GCM10011444_10320 [Winogradskyella haliclonae]|uniref:Erythromycin esterase n=2 Tax=Winogradskyella haliclonae TaxID=2048558 RepID=A0ABQ2C0S1_9FLAO|nr:hypothetical protein GCM10011444_10320 [Winogradskyella haliclonae]